MQLRGLTRRSTRRALGSVTNTSKGLSSKLVSEWLRRSRRSCLTFFVITRVITFWKGAIIVIFTSARRRQRRRFHRCQFVRFDQRSSTLRHSGPPRLDESPDYRLLSKPLRQHASVGAGRRGEHVSRHQPNMKHCGVDVEELICLR